MSLASLERLSDSALHLKTKKVRRTEHAATFDVLVHVGEIDRRRSYRALGYGSVFRYCTEELGYSSSAAGRRIQTARVIRRFPEIGTLLKRHEVNLTTVDQVAGILSESNKDRVLERIRCKSEREVRTIVESYRPPMMLKDRVRSVNVRVPAHRRACTESAVAGGASGTVAGTGGLTSRACEKSAYSRSGMAPAASLFDGRSVPTGAGATVVEKRIHVEFLARPGFMTKYNEVKAILSNTHSNASFETVFAAVMDYYLAHRSPERRAARRRETAAVGPNGSRATRSRSTRAGRSSRTSGSSRRTSTDGERSRRIPAAIRDRVYERDGGRCTFVGTTGKRCNETERLEIDHVTPFALGGTNDLPNLRLLCRAHNRLAAEQAYGKAHMRRFARSPD